MIVLGRIAAPFGVRGWVKIQAYGDDPEAWRQMPRVWIGTEDDWRAVELKELNARGGSIVAQFAGVEDRDAAQALTGLLVGAPREALPATGEDVYYWADLVGLDVINLKHERLGRVIGLISSAAHEVLQVRDEAENAERLLPFTARVVREVDRPGRVIRVDWERDW